MTRPCPQCGRPFDAGVELTADQLRTLVQALEALDSALDRPDVRDTERQERRRLRAILVTALKD